MSRITVCYFGTYIPEYPRNSIIIKGLKLHEIDVIECHYPLWQGLEPRVGKIKGLTKKFFLIIKILWSQFCLLIKHQSVQKYDLMIVGYTGHFDIFLAKILSSLRRRPLIFDFFWSMYCTFVEDRKIFSKSSPISKFIKYIDRLSCKLSNVLLLDTKTHIKYISKTLNIDEKKFRRVWVGADESIFYPIKQQNKTKDFTVLFLGTFIPLQGIETIIRAAKRIEKQKIKFKIIGKGQLSSTINNLAHSLRIKNCEFIEWVPLKKLYYEISKSDICLGIFGSTSKSKSVIPNKVFDAIACCKACITEDSPAIREIFTDKKNIFLVPSEDAKSLSQAILALKNNNTLREKIALNGYKLFIKHFSTKAIGNQMKKIVEETIKFFNPNNQGSSIFL